MKATCLSPACDWTAEGDPEAVDRAAAKHTASGHPTTTWGVGK